MFRWVFLKLILEFLGAKKGLFLKAMLSHSGILDIEYDLASYITKGVLIVYIPLLCITLSILSKGCLFSEFSACLCMLSLYSFSVLSLLLFPDLKKGNLSS